MGSPDSASNKHRALHQEMLRLEGFTNSKIISCFHLVHSSFQPLLKEVGENLGIKLRATELVSGRVSVKTGTWHSGIPGPSSFCPSWVLLRRSWFVHLFVFKMNLIL